MFCHRGAEAFAEFLYLAADIFEEGVGGPTAYYHDLVRRYFSKEELHGSGGSDGVGPHFGWTESEVVFSKYFHRVTDTGADFRACDQA